jgi:hypothetical protein
MSARRIDSLVWILIYGGMFGGGLGYALWRSGEAHGATVMALGAAAAIAGIVLVVVRSRMADPSPDSRPAAAPAATRNEETP